MLARCDLQDVSFSFFSFLKRMRLSDRRPSRSLWAVIIALTACLPGFAQDDGGLQKNKSAGDKAAADADVANLLQEAAIHTIQAAHAEAEKSYRQVLELVGTDDAASLKATIMLASAIDKQGARTDEAVRLLLNALKKHRNELGDDHVDVQRMLKMVMSMCNGLAWANGTNTEGSKEEYDIAAECAQHAVDLQQDNSMSWLLALTRFRQGDAEKSLKAMEESLAERDEDWIGQWLVMAMVQLLNEDQQAARDWYVAASDRIVGTNNRGEAILKLQTQAAELLDFEPVWPPKDWSDEKCVESLDRLLASHPNVLNLQIGRGLARARVKKWDAAKDDFTKIVAKLSAIIEAEPDDTGLRVLRGDIYARLGQWPKAAHDLEASIDPETSNSFVWLRTAPVLLLADDQAGYARLCERMLEKYGKSELNPELERTIKVSLLLPGIVDMEKLPIDKLERALKGDGVEPWKLGWGWACLGLAELRRGNAELALQHVRRAADEADYSTSPVEQALCLMIKTLALQQLNRGQEARAAYALGSDLIQVKMAGAFEHDALIAEILRREAEGGFGAEGTEVAVKTAPMSDYIKTFAGRWVCDTVADVDVEGYMKKGEKVRMEIVQTVLSDQSGIRYVWHMEKDGVIRGRSHGIAIWDPAGEVIRTYGNATGGFAVESRYQQKDGKWIDQSVVTYPDGSQAKATATISISDDGDTHSNLIADRIDHAGNKLGDKTDVWKRITKNQERLTELMGWLIGDWKNQEMELGCTASWIADGNAIQFKWSNPREHGISTILWDNADERIKMWGVGSNGGNGQATLRVEGDELIWTNAAVDSEGSTSVAEFKFVPVDETKFVVKGVDPDSGEVIEVSFAKK